MQELLDAIAQGLAQATRRRRRWIVACALLVGVPAAVLLGYRASQRAQSQLCRGAEAHLAGVWDEARRAALSAAFAPLPRGPQLFEETRRGLDAWARGWTAMRSEACEATRLRGEQSEELLDLRMGCLDQRLHETGALVELLLLGDKKLLGRAPNAVERLATLEACADQTTLLSRKPLPRNRQQRDRVEALGKRKAAVVAHGFAGEFAAAKELAQALLPEVRALAYRPLEASLLYLLGHSEERLGELKDAEATLRDSALAAHAGGDAETEVNAYVALTHLAGVIERRFADAYDYDRHAAAAIEHASGDERLASGRLYTLGAVKTSEGKNDEAIALLRECVAHSEHAFGAGSLQLAQAQSTLGLALRKQGKFDEALQLQQRALAALVKLREPGDVMEGQVEGMIGGILARQGKRAEALVHHRRWLEIYEKRLGAEHPEVANAALNVAADLRELGKAPEALEHARRAVASLEASLGPAHIKTAYGLTGLGEALLALGRSAEAIAPLERSLAVQEATKGDGENLAFARFALAQALWEDGRERTRALALAQEAKDGFGQSAPAGEVASWLARHGPP
jgi:tetratricopeptide (TPR) repeat protein